jgi:prepilin-type N-terminal cleavage/methylation domain-containing protein
MNHNTRGFTLVEMLIVVAIIGVLSVVAGTAYRRYMDSARTTEAYSMLGEIRAREEAYKAEYSTYAAWTTDEATAHTYPIVDGSCKEPCYKSATVSPPDGWPALQNATTGLGINPARAQLQCGYITNAGGANVAASGTICQALFNNAAPTAMWWCAIAICDNDGNTATNATFATASSSTVVSAQNEHK